MQKKIELVEALLTFECLPLNIKWSEIIELHKLNLKRGINKVGIPDLLILQNCKQSNVSLWSIDKHFKLMQNYVDFDLIFQNY